MTPRFAIALALLAAAPRAASASPVVGVMADVGVPDGGMASLVVRPFSTVRLHAGAGHNLISTGVRAGVSWAPLRRTVSPTLSIDYGRYAEGDANALARRVSGDGAFSSVLLERVGYDFANAHVGVQLGRERVSLVIEAGVTRVTGQTRGTDAAAEPMAVTFTHDPRFEVWSLSARLGLVIYVSP